ncbi:Gfo/Idh/MocA family protein [Erythrobacter sp. YT30]|uniref:Gfo/Idh/MocA family protein n=1 Tax=Erythrobacter sp. YT30 TaxID=1735012 RepID=UPI00076CC433|nr:oxidoreductase [Erythrobacter sp. YT30]
MMGREHMANLALIDGADLVAIADPDAGSRGAAQALAEKLGQHVSLFESSEELLSKDRPDAVIIASPNHTHSDVVKPVMETGAAILLEKPMCTDVEDAKSLAKAARHYANTFWVGLEYRYMPPVTRFIERVHAGEAGDIKMLAIREHRFPFLEKVGDWNRFNRNTGGTLVEKCCHFFDLMRHILRDEPVRVFASGAQDVNHLDEQYDGETPDIIDNAFVTIDFERGARAMLDLCMFAEGSEQQEEISAVGPMGKLEVKLPQGGIIWAPRAGQVDDAGQRIDGRPGSEIETVDTPADALAAGSHHGATYFQQRDFHDCLVNGKPPLITDQDGYRSVLMGAAAQQSIAIGQPVDIIFDDHFEGED